MKNKQIDRVDRLILDILMKDATASYVDISKKIYVSAATVHVRVKSLRARGIITSAHTNIAMEELGFNVMALIGIHLERSSYYTNVLMALKKLPEITNIHYTTGKYNLFIKVVCKDTRHLHDLLNYDIQMIKGVQKTESFLSLDEPIARPISVLEVGD